MATSTLSAPGPKRNYSPWILSLLLLTVAYGLLGLTLTKPLSHASIMERCVLVKPNMARIWSVGNIEIGLAYLGVFVGMTGYFVTIFRKNRAHLIDLGIACLYLSFSFLIDYLCVQHFQPFVALLVGDAIIMTFTVIVSRQMWFQRLLGVFVPIIFLTCGVGHFLEGLSYWQLTYPFNVPWTMVTADVGFAVLVNSARFPAFIRGQDVVEDLEEVRRQREELQAQLAISAEAQAALRESEDRARLVMDAGNIGAWDWDIIGARIGWSERVYELHGMEPGSFSGRMEDYRLLLHPDDRERVAKAIGASLENDAPYQIEFRIVRPNGEIRWIATTGRVLRDAEGKPVRMLGATLDMTERKRTELEIEALNARLQRAMTETHHRVKNNLQVILALTEIPIEEGSATVPVAALSRIGQHTSSLAAIHDLLTHKTKTDAETATISTKETLEKLVPLLQKTTGGRLLRAEIDDFPIPIEDSASLAMLISEMVSNSIKHGQGEIVLTLRVQGHTAELEVYDSGSGFPPDFTPNKNGHTGLELIDSAGRHDLRGAVFYENRAEGGARTRVVFPLA